MHARAEGAPPAPPAHIRALRLLNYRRMTGNFSRVMDLRVVSNCPFCFRVERERMAARLVMAVYRGLIDKDEYSSGRAADKSGNVSSGMACSPHLLKLRHKSPSKRDTLLYITGPRRHTLIKTMTTSAHDRLTLY
ncbi:hypothetical protein EVAR_30658_1 [Eumeta japonica]|uniref:Uncharacterized protein n=1 Tax=Eumeta variegata TaxID=151549 RepID=A0A4C1VRR1_EUMVA|nr:hypothetical protein EVAR_30658_1 [Eumeta japonica]